MCEYIRGGGEDDLDESDRLWERVQSLAEQLKRSIAGQPLNESITTYQRLIYLQGRMAYDARSVPTPWGDFDGPSIVVDLEQAIEKLVIHGGSKWRAAYFEAAHHVLHNLLNTLIARLK